jgi:hypothetical protein
VAFLEAPTLANVVVFRDMPHAQTGATPYIQRHHFSAVIAPHTANIAHAVGDLGWFSNIYYLWN